MPEVELLKQLGPAGAVIAALLGCGRVIWPYFRDTYFPQKLAALREAAAAQTRIADLVERMDIRITQFAATMEVMRSEQNHQGKDIEAIRTKLRMGEPDPRVQP